MRPFLFLFLMVLWAPILHGQVTTEVILTYKQFMDRVKVHHPLALQAALQTEKGRAKVLEAKGGFDPIVFGDVDQKYFEDKQYYSLVHTGLVIPTWFGFDVKAGYEENRGIQLNPENNTASGLWYAGINVPLGQGLIIDERRAALRQAQIYEKVTDTERKLMMNTLFYEAAQAYWNWFLKYNQLLVYQEALDLSSERFTAIKQSVLFGDRPAMDTLEASIQVQTRRLSLQKATLQFVNAGMHLSVFMWVDGTIPLEMTKEAIPEVYRSYLEGEEEVLSLVELESQIDRHPRLQLYQYSLAKLDIDRKLKVERLKPTINLTYNPISEAINSNPFTAYSLNNFKWAAAVSMPLFLRKERGMLEMTNIIIRETDFMQKEERMQLLNTAKAYWNEWSFTGEQINLYARTVNDLEELFNAEQTLLQAGESSLFLVNSRETTFINAQMMLIELIAKRKQAAAGVIYSTAGFAE